MTTTQRPRVLFVAGLTHIRDGSYGGQITASMALAASGLGRRFELVPLTSSMVSIPPPPVAVRALAAGRRLARFVRELPRVDAALVFSADGPAIAEKGLMCALARLAGRGVVMRVSSGTLPATCQEHPMVERALRLMLRSAHVVCSQGAFWTEYFGRYPEAAGKVVEMGNGIVLPPPPPLRTGRGDRFVFVGGTVRAKGVFELLSAFRRVHAAHPQATLTMVGGGPDLASLREAVREAALEGSVSLPGWQPGGRVIEVLRDHDVFVFPSHGEGLPNALLEAQAAGLPAVATRVGAIPDVIAPGENGLLIDPMDTDALTAAMLELLKAPERARAMGLRGREVVEERYDIELVWPRYAEALERAVAAAR